jgi:hypothetical protein
VTSPVDPIMRRLLADVAAGIRVLQSRDGLAVSETQIRERARNIVMGLAMNYRIELLEGDEAFAEAEPGPASFRDNASASVSDFAAGGVSLTESAGTPF